MGARELATLTLEAGIENGRHPAGVAAAYLYIASRELDYSHTQADLARAADVTPATIRERFYELHEAQPGE